MTLIPFVLEQDGRSEGRMMFIFIALRKIELLKERSVPGPAVEFVSS